MQANIKPRRLFGGVLFPCDYPNLANARLLDRMMLPMVAQMHRHGILISPSHFHKLDAKLGEKQAELESSIQALIGSEWREYTRTSEGSKWAGKPFQPGSPDQVAYLLFGALELQIQGKPPRVKSGRISTDDDVLSAIKNQHPAVELVLDHREVVKLRTTYTGVLPNLVDPDRRLRTVFKPTRTTTGRLASGDRKSGKPNLQNIPIRSSLLIDLEDGHGPLPAGKQIRNGFISGDGNVLVSMDLSQIEMRVACYLSGCEKMRLVFILGQDIHTQTAIALFRLVPEEVLELLAAEKAGSLTPWQDAALKEFKRRYRLPAKNLGFGILYGQTAKGLQAKIMAEGGPFIEEAECQSYIDRWFAVYWEIRLWLEEQYRRIRQYLMVWTMFGRPRLIMGAKSTLQDKQNDADREAGNSPIQGSAGDMLKLDMGELTPVADYYQSYPGNVCWPVSTVHDELIFEVSSNIAAEFAEMGRRIMMTSCPLGDVPVDSSADMAHRWGDIK
jgi:DNA polymerase-1